MRVTEKHAPLHVDLLVTDETHCNIQTCSPFLITSSYSSSFSPVTVTREIAMGYVSATTGAVAVSVGMNRAVNVRWKLSANKSSVTI